MKLRRRRELILLPAASPGCSSRPATTLDDTAMPRLFGAAMLAALLTTLATGGDAEGASSMTMTLTSTAFAEGGAIPTRYTCEGDDVSPPLAWSALPAGTKSLALIVDDPDAPDPRAPKMTWVHWVLYDLPPTAGGLPEAVAPGALPAGTREGLNDFKRTRYGGPCPPVGRHRYFHKLFALDVVLPDLGRPSKARLEQAMQGHILARAELLGTYQKR
jgi:Raf kinase inhibitor-like YbhB/YbcL family protein